MSELSDRLYAYLLSQGPGDYNNVDCFSNVEDVTPENVDDLLNILEAEGKITRERKYVQPISTLAD
jgi:hypothetical protein